ncbi:MAG: alpha/beta hydrolase [Myxococcota bacterium]|nr:alpha/beta hydrolase [Myxococcota bacterium]
MVITTDTLDVAALAWGPTDGRPVLALHGWLDNAGSFSPLADHLAPSIRLVALDLPGHGRSERVPKGSEYHFINWVPVVFDVADALGWETFSLLGHSMGAGISTLAAGACPERIESVVFLEGLGPLTSEPKFAHRALARHLEARKDVPEQSARVFANRDEAAEKLSSAVKGLTVEAARILVERGTHEVTSGLGWSWDPRLRVPSAMRLSEAHVSAYLTNIQSPALLVLANDGLSWDEATLLARQERVSGLKVLKFDGGHHVHMDSPEEIARAIAEHFGL